MSIERVLIIESEENAMKVMYWSDYACPYCYIGETHLKKAIESVNTTIDESELEKEIEEDLENAMKPIEEVSSMINDLDESQKKVAEEISNNPQNAEKTINEEIEKLKKLKAEAEKTLKKNNNTIRFSGWWNGMGYDI